MTIRTLALASATTSLQDHRLALGAFMGPGASALQRRQGLYYYPGSADLVSASALQATVSPFVAVVDGTSNALQGQVVVVVDAAVTLTFDAGEASVVRTDRVILQIRDDTYDASGSTDARVLVLKGNTSTGAATALPASSLLLWEVDVPIGASSITFSSARSDERTWMATSLRIPVNSETERDALPTIAGLEVLRLDTGDIEQYWDSEWRSLGDSSTVQMVYKPADTSRTSTTETADPDLSLPMEANSAYTFQMFAAVSGSSTTVNGSYRATDSFPTGCTGFYHSRYPSSSGELNRVSSGKIDPANAGTFQGFSTSGTNSIYALVFEGVVFTAGTAGNFAFMWAGGGANSITLKKGSYIRLEKIS